MGGESCNDSIRRLQLHVHSRHLLIQPPVPPNSHTAQPRGGGASEKRGAGLSDVRTGEEAEQGRR